MSDGHSHSGGQGHSGGHSHDHGAVDPNLASVALEAAARFGDGDLFDRYHEEAKKTKDRRDRQRLL